MGSDPGQTLLREQERWSAEERWSMLWDEYADKPVPAASTASASSTARPGDLRRRAGGPPGTWGRNAAGYMARNVAGVGRHYVSARLVKETGVTMRALQACNWLYVRRKLIAAGELEDDLIPSHWSPEWIAQVLSVQAIVDPRRGP
jgi:hypothetical protein